MALDVEDILDRYNSVEGIVQQQMLKLSITATDIDKCPCPVDKCPNGINIEKMSEWVQHFQRCCLKSQHNATEVKRFTKNNDAKICRRKKHYYTVLPAAPKSCVATK